MEQIRQNRDHDNVTNNSSESSPSLGSATNVNTNEVPTPLLNDNVSIESSITSNDVNVNSETKDGFVMGDQKMNINDPKQSTTIMQQCPGGVVGPKIENLVCDCGMYTCEYCSMLKMSKSSRLFSITVVMKLC